MATIPDSVKAQLDADWTAAGGAEPTYYVWEDLRSTPPLGEDAIWILTGPTHFKTKIDPVNDDFTNRLHTLEIIVNTATSEDRLKEISDEVVRILNATTVADINYQRVLDRSNISNRKTFNYQEKIIYDLREYMASSAAAYGVGTTGDFAVVGDLTVGGDADITGDIIARDDLSVNDDVTVGGDLSVTGIITTATAAQIDDLLMFGSANAAWYSCFPLAIDDWSDTMFQGGALSNATTNNYLASFGLSLPTNKGTLKLYITGYRFIINDADGTNYVSASYAYGYDSNGANQAISSDGTDYKMYLDGEEVISAAYEEMNGDIVDFYLGFDGRPWDERYSGAIDEVYLLTRALSDTQVKSAMIGIDLSVQPAGKLAGTWGALKH